MRSRTSTPRWRSEDICALPLDTVTTDDALLFLWATSPKLAEAMQVLEAWGFTYRTSMVWICAACAAAYAPTLVAFAGEIRTDPRA